MKRYITIVFYALVILSLAVSCKKGDIGPEGPAGVPGPVGAPNVKYSAWFTASPWVKDTVFNIYGFNYNKAAPDITQKVLDSGVVLVFAKLMGYNPPIWSAGQVEQMPITITYKLSSAGVTYNDTWSAIATVGNLRVRFINDQNYYGAIAVAHQFRYIIVPGGMPTARLAQLSYDEICKKYNITE